jgi:predicted dehydrogenase
MNTTRRTFLQATAAGSLALAARGDAAQSDTGSQTLKMGVIGVGWYGMVDARAALKVGGVEVAAICDVDARHLQESADELEKLQGRRPRLFNDYRDLLSLESLDAVIIATPPHWHALQLIAAVQSGLDVYCEKPLAYDIREGQAIVRAVQGSGGIVQIGFQRRQSESFRQVKDFVKSGQAGRIVQADVQIHYRAGVGDATPQEPPESLDWDLWCGPAPKIPYSPQVGHKSWRLEQTTGHGHLVDWGIHNIDAVRQLLDLSIPRRVSADGGIYQYQGVITTPDTLTVHFEFDLLPVVWRHRLWGATEYAPETNNGIFLYGEKATIFASDRRWVVIPADGKAERQEFDVPVDLGGRHMADFLAAVRQRRSPACEVEDAFRSTATVQLAMIAHENHAVVEWDADGQTIVDDSLAHAMKREYRPPWKHPDAS